MAIRPLDLLTGALGDNAARIRLGAAASSSQGGLKSKAEEIARKAGLKLGPFSGLLNAAAGTASRAQSEATSAEAVKAAGPLVERYGGMAMQFVAVAVAAVVVVIAFLRGRK